MATITQISSYVQLAAKTASYVTSGCREWTEFLKTAARLYRYSFTDQLLIHAQAPDASACADYDTWSRKMNWFVRRGSRGIALVDVKDGRPQLRYVFDIKDTGRRRNSYNLCLWKYKAEEHRKTVTDALEKHYDVYGRDGFFVQVAYIASQTAKGFWKKYRQEISHEAEGSLLGEQDAHGLRVKFCEMAAYSITYIILSRCGISPEHHLSINAFSGITDFNTPRIIKTLGCVVSQSAGEMLHVIAVAVMAYEREKKAAQSNGIHKQPSAFVISAGGDTALPVRDVYVQYKSAVKDFLMKDTAYLNACRNSDKENAYMEGMEAVRRAALSVSDLRFMKFFYDMAEFHARLQQEVLDETYRELSSRPETLQDTKETSPAEPERAVSNPESVTPDQEETAAKNPESAAADQEENTVQNPGTVTPDQNPEETAAKITESTDADPETVIPDQNPEETAAKITESTDADPETVIPDQNPEETAAKTESAAADQGGTAVQNPEFVTPDQDQEEKTEAGPEPEAEEKPVTVLDESEVEELPPACAAADFRITCDRPGGGSAKEKFSRNMRAIATLKQTESEQRPATPAEQGILSQYTGWGGIPQAFDKDRADWSEEYRKLQSALTPEEYGSARASVLNAHYTCPAVIKAVYRAVSRTGFKSGNILEPSCGIGNFFGLLPEEMKKSRLYGVELDSITGRIAKLLYPEADIRVCGYEKTDFPKNFFDLAVGNVPFGQYRVSDPAYDRLGFSIHNYFFAKTLDLVRPGGIIAFVTSRYTMDAQNTSVRAYLSERADLLGAVRLPNNAFKASAGTEVVSDILFLQKRDTPAVEQPAWVQTAQNTDGFAINRYFIDHPEMVLGIPSSQSTQYGRQDYTVLPLPDADLAAQLDGAVSHIHGKYQEAAPAETDKSKTAVTIPADPRVKNYSFTVAEGGVYYRENSIMTKLTLSPMAKSRTTGMIKLRDCIHALIALQMDENVPDSGITEKQAELNRLYDAFIRKYGLINSKANRLAFDKDSSYYLLCSLEILDDDGKLERKADMFTKRTIRPHKAVTHVDTASEALTVSIGERAKVDLPFMAQLAGKTEDELVRELHGVIYKDPAGGAWQTADEYLSGNVRRKLRLARESAEQDPAYRVNVEALEAAQPKDLDASEIEVRIGATWIDKSYIQQFMNETLNTPYSLRTKITVNYSKVTAEWFITNKTSVPYRDVAAYTTYGTARANAYKILEDSLNLRDVRIYDTVTEADGKEKRVLNAKETTLAAQKQSALRDSFRDWIFRDPERRQELVKLYNELMNSTRPREYDGSHITFVGMNPEIRLQPHQVNAVARILYGGNTLLAHEVGAGKTFEIVAACMESKRLGLCHKSAIVVPNHLTEQTAAEFLRLYPAANILVTTKKDFETANRKKFCARIATSDIDAVIIGHSQFERIPVSYGRQERHLQEEIREITDGISEVKASNGERFTVKQLERTKKSLEARLKKLQADHRKDDVVTFEQLGVDMMFVDESDMYKNLFLYTKMRNVAGLSTADAQKSSDMFMKCRYLDETTGGRGIVFATGTPVSNSMTELYSIQRYLQYSRLQQLGMACFDAWASHFGETVTALELAPEGTGYRARTRFARFFNLPELMNLFKEVADIKTSDQLNLPTPEAEYHTIVSQPTGHQKAMVEGLSKRAEKVHKGIDPSIDNMLRITSDGRKLGLDQRIINPLLPDDPGSKVNMCVENVLKHYREGDQERLTQLVFCDISTPKNDGSFNIYDDIRRKLIAGGMAGDQIAYIHQAKTDIQKKELFARVRSGQVRVLIGSTQKMGAGTNVQDRLIALHDLDCPWRPRDLVQRAGRIVRRGNRNPKVEIYRYVTNGTFDAYLWQTIESKQKFISQIMTSRSPVRSCEDVDEAALSYAEIKALCAGDPRIKERMDLDLDVSRLKIMKADHQGKKFRMEDDLMKHFPEQIAETQSYIVGLQADIRTLKQNLRPDGSFAGMEIRGKTYTDKEAAGTALIDACRDAASQEPEDIGSYLGFSVSVRFNGYTHKLVLKGTVSYQVELGDDIYGNITRINNALGKMESHLESYESKLANLLQQQEAAKAEAGKPFPHEEELRIKSARLAELDAQLNIGAPRTVA